MPEYQGPFPDDPLVRLPDTVQQLQGWAYSQAPGSDAIALEWAERLHHESAMIMSILQDRVSNGHDP